MRAAVYARFSSENDREQSIDDQVRVCRGFAERDGIEVVEQHVYFDEAQSGSIRSRPGLEALKKAAEDKQFDVVLVDDSSRLSRDNQHFNTLLCLFQYWGICLISVSDGLDMREEHAKVAYQCRGIISELYLSDLKKKTHRGQMGQVLRGFTVGTRGYGYQSVPDGETKHDKKGRLRADGFKLAIVPEEAQIIRRIYEDFIAGQAVTRIAKDLNTEKVPTAEEAPWRVERVDRLVDPQGRQVHRHLHLEPHHDGEGPALGQAQEGGAAPRGVGRSGARGDADHLRRDARGRRPALAERSMACSRASDGSRKSKKGKRGYQGKTKSYVKSHPKHLLSGSLKCGSCDGRHRPREWQGQRLLRLHERLAEVLRQQGPHLAQAAGEEASGRPARRGASARGPRRRLPANGREG